MGRQNAWWRAIMLSHASNACGIVAGLPEFGLTPLHFLPTPPAFTLTCAPAATDRS